MLQNHPLFGPRGQKRWTAMAYAIIILLILLVDPHVGLPQFEVLRRLKTPLAFIH